MTSALRSYLDHARAVQLQMLELGSAYGSRLAAWCVVGNAGALGLTYSATLAGTACSQRTLAELSAPFAVGLATAGLGSILAYGSVILNLMETSRTGLKFEAMAAAENNRDRVAAGLEEIDVDLQERAIAAGGDWGLSWRFKLGLALLALSTALFVISLWKFGEGTLGPTVLRRTDFQSCMGSIPETKEPPAVKPKA